MLFTSVYKSKDLIFHSSPNSYNVIVMNFSEYSFKIILEAVAEFMIISILFHGLRMFCYNVQMSAKDFKG